ncbi:hypothetical protein QIA30_00555 (plasmid) [Borreliella turdi]|nr:hypothetical protein [Borreliella turdi]WKC77594.1 hypothetical protein QIA31_00530 [Borreliella turdi]WKC78512.1 hypothetical protein QIA30_00555 [Borreliella turdi]
MRSSIDYLIRNGYTSPLERVFTFNVKAPPIGYCKAIDERHRAAARN